MVNEDTLSYIIQHRTDDPRKLALQSRPSCVDMAYALEQIAGWQAARQKLPRWASTEGVVFPPHLSMEQCSSELTASYKSGVANRLLGGGAGDKEHSLVDLTGGFGVDFSYLARCFKRATYVERQQRLCELASHNMPLLGLPEAEIVCADGTEYLQSLDHVSMIFVDPARRDDNGGKTFAISDCTPDVAALADMLVEKADYVFIKLSPMLDWHKAVADMRYVSEVHVVAVRNECKELLLVLHKGKDGESSSQTRLFCVDSIQKDDGGVEFATDCFDVEGGHGGLQPSSFANPMEDMYLYEPNASLMKAGCFAELSLRFGVSQVSRNSHLFLSDAPLEGFHGRCFRIRHVSSMNKKELRKSLAGITKANIAVRNFPLSVAELRKRLKLKDGGSDYIFATTLQDDSHVLLLCEKA